MLLDQLALLDQARNQVPPAPSHLQYEGHSIRTPSLPGTHTPGAATTVAQPVTEAKEPFRHDHRIR